VKRGEAEGRAMESARGGSSLPAAGWSRAAHGPKFKIQLHVPRSCVPGVVVPIKFHRRRPSGLGV